MKDKPFHVVLPTLNFEVFYNKFFKCIPVFSQLKNFFSFGICFQNYTKEEINIVKNEFNKYDLDLRYIHKQYNFEYGKTKMHIIRNDCAQLNPNCLYYFVLDDDQWFDICDECIIELLKSIIFLLENQKCAVLSLQKFDCSKKKNFQIELNIYRIETYLGLFLKNINKNGQIVSDEFLNLIGGHNDIILSCSRLYTKEYCAFKQNFLYGHHVESKPRSEIGFNAHGWKNAISDKDSNATMRNKLIDRYRYVYDISNYNFNVNKEYFINGTKEELIRRAAALV